MCIIIDNNVVARVLTNPADPDFGDLHRALVLDKRIRVRMQYGGRLGREYANNHAVRRLLVVLDAAGRAQRVSDADVDAEEKRVKREALCRSDDEHIIALARVAKVRVLCSHDAALQADFRDKQLLDNPRGKIYLRAEHRKLLQLACR